MCIASALLAELGYGAIPVIASDFVRQRFGGKNHARNRGLVNLGAALASFFGIGMVAPSSPDGASTNLPAWIAFAAVYLKLPQDERMWKRVRPFSTCVPFPHAHPIARAGARWLIAPVVSAGSFQLRLLE